MVTASLHAALPASGADGAPPEWLHLVPAGTFRGMDGRGPYTLADAQAVIAASMARGPLVLDENHATDHALKTGISAPAMGWVVELQAREDGIWGGVEWTPAGIERLAGRAYRGVSPVIATTKAGRILQVLRAALTNAPNLPQLSTIHTQGNPMDLTKLREALGLPDDADEAAVLAAITTARHSQAALQAKVDDLARRVVSLQTQADAATRQIARDRATAASDAAITAGKPIKALRDHYIERHMADAAAVEKELGAMVSLHSGGAKPPAAKGADGLSEADEQTIQLMGLDREA
jgi:phage I-like protein